MKKTLLFLFLIPLFIGCSKSDSGFLYENEDTIFSDQRNNNFREVLIMLRPYLGIESQKKYILTDSIFNVHITINQRKWGIFSSLVLDTSLFENTVVKNYRVTEDNSVKYGIIAPFQTTGDRVLTTAGQYADLINNYFTLDPGFYLFKIESFDIKDLNGNIKTMKTSIVQPVEVKENTMNAFIGEFEVLVN